MRKISKYITPHPIIRTEMSDQDTIHGNRIYFLERKLLDLEQELVDIKEQQIFLNDELARVTTEAMFTQHELNDLKIGAKSNG